MQISIVDVVGAVEHPTDPSKGILCSLRLSEAPDATWLEFFYSYNQSTRVGAGGGPSDFKISGNTVDFTPLPGFLEAGQMRRLLQQYIRQANASYSKKTQQDEERKRQAAEWKAGQAEREAKAKRELES